MKTRLVCFFFLAVTLIGCNGNSTQNAASPSPDTAAQTPATVKTPVAQPLPESRSTTPPAQIYSNQAPTATSPAQQPAAETPVVSQASGQDYKGRTSQATWVVVDPDPAGLNCRWSDAMPADWVSPGASDRLPELNIGEWPVVRRFPTGTVLEANLAPAGFATMMDNQGRPWLKVNLGPNNQICLVRANEKYVKPS